MFIPFVSESVKYVYSMIMGKLINPPLLIIIKNHVYTTFLREKNIYALPSRM